MRFMKFDFGTKEESSTEGKGIDWMLDPFLQKKVTGQAGFDYEVVKARPDIVAEVLNEKYDYDDVSRVLQSHQFQNLFLGMNIKMNDPDTWALSWGRFEFEIGGSNVSVLSFAPNLEGIKTIIEKNGSRDLNLSLTGEIGMPVISGIGDSKITPGVTYNKKNGWTVKFDDTVEEVKGFKIRTINGTINLQWDIYKNKAVTIPESNIGETAQVYATALISTPKDSKIAINVKVSGETSHIGASVRSRGIIELASRATFNVQPTL